MAGTKHQIHRLGHHVSLLDINAAGPYARRQRD